MSVGNPSEGTRDHKDAVETMHRVFATVEDMPDAMIQSTIGEGVKQRHAAGDYLKGGK